jgi:3-deoxy-manno-octulosonate cytidylyltransferase (CMP-KDO synthetase)
VNLQGDEPLMPATNIKRVAALLNGNSSADMATLMEPLDRDIAAQESIVKVVASESGKALYFSRAPIPGHRHGTPAAPMYRHVGLYAYRVGFLKKFVTWPLTAMEQSESLEQLRALANDAHIQIEVAPDPAPTGVDTEADLIRHQAAIGPGKLMLCVLVAT